MSKVAISSIRLEDDKGDMKNIQTKRNQNSLNFQNLQNVVKRMIKKLYNEESGSAIILALIIVAGLAGTGLGAARLAKSNTQQASIYENSLKAFYAAEAGIESALLEWRFDHNVEFWNQEMALKCFHDDDEEACDGATVKKYVLLQGDEDANIEDISDRFDEYGELKDGYNTPRGQGWYEMEISYRNPRYPFRGNYHWHPSDASFTTYPEIIQTEDDLMWIGKDKSLEISFPSTDEVKQLNIRWNADLTNNGLRCGDTGIEECLSRLIVHPVAIDENGVEKLVEADGQGYIPDDEYFIEDYASSYYGDDAHGENYWVILNGSNYKGLSSIRFKCLSTDVNGGCYLGLEATKGVVGGDEKVFIPQDQVQIIITGHYGDVERTLEYNIDRKSGTILDIFDHGVYSKETLRK